MSGHSKWANIKRQKALVDAKKGAAYARLSREIIVAARGGADVSANSKLRQAVDRARTGGMPNDNIQRAIEKGAGGGQGANLEELVYEGYGPGGVAIMVRCTTDNRNRTAADMRLVFSKYGGNMGETGCVNWIFKERGEVIAECDENLDEEALLALALDAGADDLEDSGKAENARRQLITFICAPEEIESVKEKLSANTSEAAKGNSGAGNRQESGRRANLAATKPLEIISAQANLVAQSVVDLSDKNIAQQLLKLLDAIENQDDVQQVYANFDMDNAWLEELAV